VDLSWSADDDALRRDLRTWLSDHRPPTPATADLADVVDAGRSWQATLADGGWVGITWPVEHGGRGLGASANLVVHQELARAGSPELVGRIGVNLVGPTLLLHGTDAQCQRWLPPILPASELWCQLFSEPDAGSDLASLTTRAVRAGDGWVVSGRKVWTSYAQFADLGLCLARTTPGSRGPRGLSMLVVDMHAEGVTVRPLVQMTGDAEFNEVTLDEVHVPPDHLIGPEGDGWTVAATTLAHERGTNFPFKEEVLHEGYLGALAAEAVARGSWDDPDVADALADCLCRLLVLRTHNWRTLSDLAHGRPPGPGSSWVKLTWSDLTQHLAAASVAVLGADAVRPGPWSRQWMWSRAASIAGGTSEVQRTIIGERILGLPRQARPAGGAGTGG
jgi:alkylation response protein AidB-like acyl-CoA dehydrogenase